MSLVLLDEVRPKVAQITLNDPDKLNPLSWALVDELHAALDEVGRDNSIRVVVLTGAGRGFCSGLDLTMSTGSQMSAGLSGPAAGMRSQAYMADVMLHLRRIPQPVIAAVNGPAIGGGIALALYSDLRVSAASARYSVRFVKVGVSGCDMGVSYALPKIVGATQAFELSLTGRTFDADEALRIGLVGRVVPDAEVLDAAYGLADEILANSPFGVVMTKEVLWANLAASSAESAIALENRTQILASGSGDYEEAVRAFAEKRAPNFG
jgi:enoyl-CoA hydratase/carnithine racemase